MVKVKKFIYAKRFEGEVKLSDFELVENELPPLQDGEFLAEALYLSVDPYMRVYMTRYPLGITMVGGQIAKIIESKVNDYPIGTIICGHLGWQTHTIINPSIQKPAFDTFYVLPSFGDSSKSLGLGVLGMPGITAYFGLMKICEPKSGDVVVVSGAAGAVGNIVGQIAKIHGCHVIGIAGSDEKCTWLKDELGFDATINYKTVDNLASALKLAAPNGIDCYFDNVGGKTTSIVISQLKAYGRISVCGSISSYNNSNESIMVPDQQVNFVFRELKMEGFVVRRWGNLWMDGIEQLTKWFNEGKLKYRETITNGFENMPQALIEMMQGKNIGKAIVKCT